MPRSQFTTYLPPLLAPYILGSSTDHNDQHNSLTMITYTLSASPMWLLLRYLGIGLQGARVEGESSQCVSDRGGVGVVLASFVRDWECWRDGARKLVSEDGVYATSLEMKTYGCDMRGAKFRSVRSSDNACIAASLFEITSNRVTGLLMTFFAYQKFQSTEILYRLIRPCHLLFQHCPSSSSPTLSDSKGRASISHRYVRKASPMSIASLIHGSTLKILYKRLKMTSSQRLGPSIVMTVDLPPLMKKRL